MSKRVTVRVPKSVLEDVERVVEAEEYENVSDAFREGVTRLDGVGSPRRLVADGDGREISQAEAESRLLTAVDRIAEVQDMYPALGSEEMDFLRDAKSSIAAVYMSLNGDVKFSNELAELAEDPDKLRTHLETELGLGGGAGE